MEKYLCYPDVNTLNGKWGLSENKTFEFLCKALLEKYYNFSEGFIIGSNDSWVECPAIKDSDWKYHAFQAKFSKKSTPLLVESFFSEKMTIKNLELKSKDDLKIKIKEHNLDILHIFYLWGVNDESKHVIEEKLQLFYPNLEVLRYKSEEINKLLRDVNSIDIAETFFPAKQILTAVHTQDSQIAQSRSENYIREKIAAEWDDRLKSDIESCFEWNYTEKDVNLATNCYDHYLLTKYSFITTPSFKYFKKIESFVEDDKFEDLMQHTEYDDLNFYKLLKDFTDELSKIPETRPEKISLDLLIDKTESRKWILINSAVHNKCNFIVEHENKVLFRIIKDVN